MALAVEHQVCGVPSRLAKESNILVMRIVIYPATFEDFDVLFQIIKLFQVLPNSNL